MTRKPTLSWLPIAAVLAASAVLAGYLVQDRETDSATRLFDPVTVVRGNGLSIASQQSDANDPLPDAGYAIGAGDATRGPDALLAAVLPDAPSDTRMMHHLATSQMRDARAIATEETMKRTFVQASATGARARDLRIRCVMTLCEVAGTVQMTSAEVQADLHESSFSQSLPPLGYSPGPRAVATSGGRTIFVVYVNREV